MQHVSRAHALRQRWAGRVVPTVSCRSSSGNGPGEGSNSESSGGDIDMLARMLSQQAQALRSSMSEEEVEGLISGEEEEEEPSTLDDEGLQDYVAPDAFVIQQQQQQSGPPPQLTQAMERMILDEIGTGGFGTEDFEILQQLGRIETQEAGTQFALGPRTAVIAYLARFISRMPFTRPVPTMLKEYLPVAKAVALNELLLLNHLCGIPEYKYEAADALSKPRDPPIVPLLGYFCSAPTPNAAIHSTDLDQDSVWLVYKWEGLRPMNLYLDAGPPQPQGFGLFKSREKAQAEAWENRVAMLKSLSRQLLCAVDFIHSADTVHGSLSSGCVFVNTSSDLKYPEDLVLKLDGFGFGKWYTPAQQEQEAVSGARTGSRAAYGGTQLDMELEEGKRQDLQASALLLVEAFTALLASSPSGVLTRPSLQRLLFDVFHEDLGAFREYCLEDSEGNFDRMVQVLDEGEGEGWNFLSALLRGDASALQLSQHPFLSPFNQ